MNMRTERDSLGTRSLPASAYYGIQTARAIDNFPISGLHLPVEMIRAYALIKHAAAVANHRVGWLDRRKAHAITRACEELSRGRFDAEFVVDVYQAGAGTSFNMNVNEVLANRANELLGGRKGAYRFVHPNDHVNMAQSTNDTFPTAIRLACLMKRPALVASLKDLERALRAKATQFARVVKSGRTHLQDAVPVSLGDEFRAYALAVAKARTRIEQAARLLGELNLGGTATGTGLNAHLRYRTLAVGWLRQRTGFSLRPAEHLMERTQSLADFGHVSGTLRSYSLELIRIANDLRLMSSGPSTALAEIELPAVQPGSSIMPGKVNPVMAEMIDMVGFQVIGHDATVAIAVQAGQLELNVMMPVVAYNLLQAMHIVTTSTQIFARRCVRGITADAARCAQLASRSFSLVTALAPRIGYLNAAQIAKEALVSGKSIQALVVEQGLLSRSDAARLLNPRRLARIR